MADPFSLKPVKQKQAFSAKGSLSFAPKVHGVNKLPKVTSPALETEPSNLEKALDVLNKPGAIERQIAINSIQGDPWDKGVSDIAGWNPNQGVLRNLNNLVSANPTYQPTGGDVIQALRGGKAPETTLGKVGQGVAGFVADVLNPADPLNWVGVGEATKAGKAAQMLGKAKDLIPALEAGERSILSARVPFTKTILHVSPEVSAGAGKILGGIGQTIKAVPGVGKLAEAFKPTLNVLKGYGNKAISTAKGIVGGYGGTKLEGNLNKLFSDAVSEVGNLEKINKPMADYYKGQGVAKPEDIVNREIFRGLEKSRGLDETRAARDKIFKEPAIQRVINSVPKAGPTTDKIQNIVDILKPVYKGILEKQKNAGIQVSKLADYVPHYLSVAGKKSLEDLGIPLEHGSRTASKEFTLEEANAISKDPEARAKLYAGVIGTGALKKEPRILDFLKKADPKGADFYSFDALTNFGRHLETGSKAVGVADALKDILSNPDLARESLDKWAGSQGAFERNVVPVDIPERFSGVLKKTADEKATKRVWVPADTAKEFRNFLGIFTDAQKAQMALGAVDSSWRTLTGIYKKLTLLTPLGGLHTMFRDAIGNHMQSYLAGAWSKEGNAIAAKLQLALTRAGDSPERFAQEASKLGVANGLDLAHEFQVMRDANLLNEGFTKSLFGAEHFNKLEKGIGMQKIAQAREISENFSRIQHYITRRLQGWNEEGALKDTRKVLYDYVNGISPFERKAQNIFPWYTWSRFNIPMMIETALKNPGKFSEFYRAKTNIESQQNNKPDERALDEYIKGDPHIRLWQDPKSGKWTYVRLKGFLPQGDLEDVTSLTKFGELLQSSLTPYLKVPLENTFNTSLFFKNAGGGGSQIEQYPGETGQFLGQPVTKKNINILKNIRPLNEVNRLIGGSGQATLNPGEYGLSQAGLSLVPVDMSKSVENARYAYTKQLANLKMAKRRQENKGKPTAEIDSLIRSLGEKSFTPGGQHAAH
jgi:hypothetical protein